MSSDQTLAEPFVNISVVVMAFNEEDGLRPVVSEVIHVLDQVNREYEVVIVDDGSTDATNRIAERLASEYVKVKLVRHDINKGLGGVYRTGFSKAQGDFVTFVPADGQFPAAFIKKFAALIQNADIVLGYIPKRESSLLAKGLSRMEKVLYRLMYGHLPKFQGVFMLRRSLLKELELKSQGRGWSLVMELIIRASRKGYRLISIPTEMRPRMAGKSKVNNLPTIWANLKEAFSLYWQLKQTR